MRTTTTNDKLHNQHCEALMRQLIVDTTKALEQSGISDIDLKRKITEAILFNICVVLDGSAHGGTLGERPIAPFIGACK
jgi:hypothetical protein